MVFHQNGSQVSMAQMNLTDVDLPSLTSALDRLLLDLRRSTQEDLLGVNVGIIENWESLRKEMEMMMMMIFCCFNMITYDHAKGQRKTRMFFERPRLEGFLFKSGQAVLMSGNSQANLLEEAGHSYINVL